MEIQFLGTSSGTPTNKRNVSAIALSESKGRAWYLIDCGEGTQHQLLRSHLSLNTLEAIFLTHLHGDHCYGLPGLLASAGLNGRTKPLKIIAPDGAEQWITLTKEISDLYLPYELEFIDSANLAFEQFGQFIVSKVVLSHRISSYGYVFNETTSRIILNNEKLLSVGIPAGPLWGKLQAGEDIVYNDKLYEAKEFVDTDIKFRKVIICGDNDTPELLESDCADCDLLVHESTFTEELAEQAKNVGHSHAELVATFAEKVGVPNLILTHISARYGSTTDMQQEASACYSGKVFVARDFDRFRLSAHGVLELFESQDS